MTGLVAVITAVCPTWIELVSRWDPDRYEASAERLIVTALFIATAALFALAARERRRGPATALE